MTRGVTVLVLVLCAVVGLLMLIPWIYTAVSWLMGLVIAVDFLYEVFSL